jgi:hypothetical protein
MAIDIFAVVNPTPNCVFLCFLFQGAMMSICFKEGIKISPETLNDIITGTNHDVRQVLHHLSLWSVRDKQLSFEGIKAESVKAKKDIKMVSLYLQSMLQYEQTLTSSNCYMVFPFCFLYSPSVLSTS